MATESEFERALLNELHCYYSSEVDDIDFTSTEFLQNDLMYAANNSCQRLRIAVGDSDRLAYAAYLDELAADRTHEFFARLGDEVFEVSEDRDWQALQQILTAIADAIKKTVGATRHST